MQGKSHYFLGIYLIDQYMPQTPKLYIRAFLAGCVEPDKNPLTYLKGSFRHSWLRGHNYHNARRYMQRISRRLEQRRRWSVLDYYTLGKLIHYTADTFTLAHNEFFPSDLKDHRAYEAALQSHFLRYLQNDPQVEIQLARSIIEIIAKWHDEYSVSNREIHTDIYYILCACSCIFIFLFSCRIV